LRSPKKGRLSIRKRHIKIMMMMMRAFKRRWGVAAEG